MDCASLPLQNASYFQSMAINEHSQMLLKGTFSNMEPSINANSIAIVDVHQRTSNVNPDVTIQRNHLDASSFHEQLSASFASYYDNYTNVYSTLYMASHVKQIAQRFKSEFSITEFLPMEENIENCDCCLCKLRLKNDDTHEFCIKQHPLEESCTRGLPRYRNNHQTKYQLRHVCDQCMSVTITTKRKSKKKVKMCKFCSQKFGTLAPLRKHILNTHFNVKMYICNVCEKDFHSRSTLKKHEREKH